MKYSSFLEKKTFASLIPSFLLGGFCVLSFAPFNLPIIIFICLIGLLIIIKKNRLNGSYHAVVFGLGFFLSGIYWITICLNEYGQMHIFLSVIFTFFLCFFLALFFIPLSFFKKYHLHIFLIPVIFTLTEWFRSIIFTGFPWLSLGYSQVPNGPLAGFIPIAGIHGVTFLILITITILFKIFQNKYNSKSALLIVFLFIIWGAGEALKKIDWVNPVNDPISISLIQGNIAQDKKWSQDFLNESLLKYLNLIKSSDAKLIILPETSIPLMFHQIPSSYLDEIMSHATINNGNVILGAIEKKENQFFNAAFSIGIDPIQYYRKHHLVPFGEFMPLKPLINYIYEHWLNIPFSDLSSGNKIQAPISVSNQIIGLNICYEDVFGYEIIKALPEATLLVNLSNDAWYGNSIAASQHLQISQARAIETQRMMLRATNTGVTSIIDKNGYLIGSLPQHKTAKLDGLAQGYQGSTPFSRLGNFPLILLCLAYLLFFVFIKNKRNISSL